MGWAFKKDTNDTRESAAIYVADYLLNERANVVVFDPKVPSEKVYTDLDYLNTRSSDENRKLVTVANDPYEACKGAHAVAILTEWDEFKILNWEQIHDSMLKPANLFDGRNILEPSNMSKIGFRFQAIGKSL